MTAESEIKPLFAPRVAGARNVADEGEQPAHGGSRRPWAMPILGSPLTRRILTLNVLVLLIPVLGLLHLEQYRDSLIEAELDALAVQGRAFALSLAGGAVAVSPAGEESIVPESTRQVMRLLLQGSSVRARLFDRSGSLVSDSFRLTGKGGQVHVVELPPPDQGTAVSRTLSRMLDRAIDWLPGVGHLPVYYEAPVQRAGDYEENTQALAGKGGGMARVDRRGGLVLSAAVPVQRYRQVLGALMLSKDGGDVEAAVRHRRRDILLVFAIALGVTVLLSIYLASTIARPVQRLAEAADRVRHAKGRQVEIPDMTHRGDEVGDLSGALIDMTESLWTRLDAIERFAADVAHEIKNPLTSVRSAVETVARVDDPEQQKRLMGIILDDVQRLDRLISDISDASRLDAELSRAQTEQVDLAQLLTALVETYESTSGEKRLSFVLDFPAGRDLTVQGIEGRLGQVFRNLISNAISFSPEEGTIRLVARPQAESVEVIVEDEGQGIPETKLQSIFDRFYSERPRGEKFGTHSGLGLSISKQIVEAHNGEILAENRRNSSGNICGARFRVRLPRD